MADPLCFSHSFSRLSTVAVSPGSGGLYQLQSRRGPWFVCTMCQDLSLSSECSRSTALAACSSFTKRRMPPFFLPSLLSRRERTLYPVRVTCLVPSSKKDSLTHTNVGKPKFSMCISNSSLEEMNPCVLLNNILRLVASKCGLCSACHEPPQFGRAGQPLCA